MQREIKFRAWVKEAMPQVIFQDNMQPVKIINWEQGSFATESAAWFDIGGKAPLMQFTGLLDKNRKEIYEGDIIEDSVGNAVVIFKDGAFRIDIAFCPILGEYNYSCSVLGNIYENPNLRKETN